MSKRYVPNTGDIIYVHFDSAAASSSPEHKPAVVLSPLAYNKKTGLMACCPIVAKVKGYPFEVLIGEDGPVVLADQIKSLDWVHTKISYQGHIDSAQLAEVRAKPQALIFKN